MLNVLFLTRSLDLGGAERQLVVLASELARRGHQVRVAVFYGGGELAAELDRAGVPILDLAKRGRWDTIGFGLRLRRAVLGAAPDVVHGYLVAANLAASALRAFAPGARIVWGVRASDMDLSRYGAFEEWTFQLGRHAARTADRILANSDAGRRYHVDRGYPGDRTIVIPNGIDTERFRPRPELRGDARRDLGVDPEAPLVGYVARLDPMKDHGTFLRAAAETARRRPDVRFVAVGGGPPEVLAHWRREVLRAGLSGRVSFAGHRGAIEHVLPAFDVATSTSAFGEGFPNAVAEAMAVGLPCVVTDVGDAARIVARRDRVVARGDADGLARAWVGALDGRSVDDPEATRRSIVDRFSVGRMVDATEAVLRDLIGERA